MKRAFALSILAGLAGMTIGLTSAFASPTDYTCKLSDMATSRVLAENCAKINYNEMARATRGKEKFLMLMNNGLGAQLTISILDKSADYKPIFYAEVALNQTTAHNPHAADGNPKKLSFEVLDRGLRIDCDRADDIQYGRGIGCPKTSE